MQLKLHGSAYTEILNSTKQFCFSNADFDFYTTEAATVSSEKISEPRYCWPSPVLLFLSLIFLPFGQERVSHNVIDTWIQ